MNLDLSYIDVIEFEVVTSQRKRDVRGTVATTVVIRDGDVISAAEAVFFFTNAVRQPEIFL